MGEGLAIGCLEHGVVSVTSTKMTLEFAFMRAWRDWRWASTFPVVRASLERNDLLRILHDSERRRGSIVAAWSCGRRMEPHLRMDGWDINDGAEVLQAECGVPLSGWSDLASVFVADLGEDNVTRSA